MCNVAADKNVECESENTMGKFEELSRKTAAEGAVLLFNKNHVLPLKQDEKISIFGRNQIEYYRSGTGSGGAVKVSYSTNLYDGLKNSGVVLVNDKLTDIYKEYIKEHPFDNGGGGWAAEPWFQKDLPLTKELVNEAALFSDKAIYCIGRTAGEDKDNLLEEGSFLLTKTEEQNLLLITNAFKETVVLLNTNNFIDMSFIDDLKDAGKVSAIIYAWAGGMEGGNAIADVLTGKVSPSGKLPDTIAEYKDYPSQNHGGEDFNIYEEDIYVGYRYFETFAPKKVKYEFGFGLSYTEFAISTGEAVVSENEIRIPVCVTNVGSYSGKEVVELYVSAPQGKLGKPAKELVTFAKTNELKPLEKQELTLCVKKDSLASYDDSGVTGFPYSYVLEAGKYDFYVGNSVRNTVLVEGFDLKETVCVKKLSQALAPRVAFNRLKPGKINDNNVYEKALEATPLNEVDLEKRILENIPEEIPYTGKKGIFLKDVKENRNTMDEFVAQLSDEDLSIIVRGEGMGHPDVTPGTASAFGSVSDNLKDLGIPLACAADGPSGVRMENGKTAVQLPIGTLLAATWNVPLVEELYTYEGKEIASNDVDTLLGPGMNIHRNPLNGRNFEYYSEDPLLTGLMGAAASTGIRNGGAFATVKHFAVNSQEKRRSFVNAILSERALREIYLKGFEIAVASGSVCSLMTSYNPVNGFYAASNYDLTTTILRNEWGYEGIVMTDWWAKMNDVVSGGEGVIQKTRDMVRAQNDLYMVVNNYGAEINNNQDDTLTSLKEGRLTRSELQRSAKNILGFVMNTKSFERVGLKKTVIPQALGVSLMEGRKVSAVIENINGSTYIDVEMEKDCYIEAKEDVVVTFIARMMSPDSNMVQNTAQIVVDNEPLMNIQTQGTQGAFINQKLIRVELKKGIHSIRPEVIKPHLIIERVELKVNK